MGMLLLLLRLVSTRETEAGEAVTYAPCSRINSELCTLCSVPMPLSRGTCTLKCTRQDHSVPAPCSFLTPRWHLSTHRLLSSLSLRGHSGPGLPPPPAPPSQFTEGVCRPAAWGLQTRMCYHRSQVPLAQSLDSSLGTPQTVASHCPPRCPAQAHARRRHRHTMYQ